MNTSKARQGQIQAETPPESGHVLRNSTGVDGEGIGCLHVVDIKRLVITNSVRWRHSPPHLARILHSVTATPEDHRRALEEGESVGAYRIERSLGSGGFGLTYLARDECLDRLVALKEFMPLGISHRSKEGGVGAFGPTHQHAFDAGLKRFLTEARLLGRVDHSNVARVLSAFELNGTGYMVMAYEPGSTLAARIRRQRRMSESKLRTLALGLLDALDAIHAAGIVHRDVKPSNILMARDNRPILLDFGSATRVQGDRCDAGSSTISPGYSPIELYQPEHYPQGPWTDIYGVAAIVYRIITGVRPAPPIGCANLIEADPSDSGVFTKFTLSAVSAAAGDFSERFLAAVDHGLETYPDRRPDCTKRWRKELLARCGKHSKHAAESAADARAELRSSNDLAACRKDSNAMLLARARRMLGLRRPSDKKRAKTLECCRRILTSDPTHGEARKIIKQLVFEALAEARAALEIDAAERAWTLLRFAESVFPGDVNVEHLRRLLRARVAPAAGARGVEKTNRGTSAA